MEGGRGQSGEEERRREARRRIRLYGKGYQVDKSISSRGRASSKSEVSPSDMKLTYCSLTTPLGCFFGAPSNNIVT